MAKHHLWLCYLQQNQDANEVQKCNLLDFVSHPMSNKKSNIHWTTEAEDENKNFTYFMCQDKKVTYLHTLLHCTKQRWNITQSNTLHLYDTWTLT